MVKTSLLLLLSWAEWAAMFEESGFAVYKTTHKVSIPKVYDDDEGEGESTITRHRLDVREVLDNLRNKF